eukprot:TRINITY_DN54640_c0_g1_i1.p1 TRINITY_DN54640_c0_g1~~TRINITY_DN54640_c0_g1_i1.p1  ORF type:complete len:1217 (+),score=187.56 TRINITY_DN54640_c0_g1_i1:167-3817(+)
MSCVLAASGVPAAAHQEPLEVLAVVAHEHPSGCQPLGPQQVIELVVHPTDLSLCYRDPFAAWTKVKRSRGEPKDTDPELGCLQQHGKEVEKNIWTNLGVTPHNSRDFSSERSRSRKDNVVEVLRELRKPPGSQKRFLLEVPLGCYVSPGKHHSLAANNVRYLYYGFADVLELQEDGTYTVKEIKSGSQVRSEHVLQAMTYALILQQMVNSCMEDEVPSAFPFSSDLSRDVQASPSFAVVIETGETKQFQAVHFHQVFRSVCDKFEGLLLLARAIGLGIAPLVVAPEPFASECRRDEYAHAARQRMMETDSLELLPGVSEELRTRLRREFATLTGLRTGDASEAVLKRLGISAENMQVLKTHAALFQPGQEEISMYFLTPTNRSAAGTGAIDHILVNVVRCTGGHGRRFAVGKAVIRDHADLVEMTSSDVDIFSDVTEFCKSLERFSASGAVFFYYGQEVRDEFLEAAFEAPFCGDANGVNVLKTFLHWIFMQRRFVDVKSLLRRHCALKCRSYSLDDVCSALNIQQSSAVYFLPAFVDRAECGQIDVQTLEDSIEALFTEAFVSLACVVKTLHDHDSSSLRASPAAAMSPVLQDLFAFCERSRRGGGANEDDSALLNLLADYHKRELFPKLLEMVDLMDSDDDVWRATELCLAGMTRELSEDRIVVERIREGRWSHEKMRISYLADSPQKTKIKKDNEVVVKEIPSLRGKVVAITHFFPSEQGIWIELEFDTRYGKNKKMRDLLKEQHRRISVVQTSFSFRHGKDVFTAAIEDLLDNVTCTRVDCLSSCFRHLLEKRAHDQDLAHDQDIDAHNINLAIASMESTCLAIQGPPGTGKTHTAALAVAHLMSQPCASVLVSANSHVAIVNLLEAIKRRLPNILVGKVVGTNETEDDLRQRNLEPMPSEDPASFLRWNHVRVIGGTVSQLRKLDGDYTHLFIDEAGQLALATLMALAGANLKIENLVLVGDQNQLECPVDPRRHPGRSSLSCFDHFADGAVHIGSRKGFFLGKTYRMNMALTGFVSNHYYGGKLGVAESRGGQNSEIVLGNQVNLIPRGAGVVFLEAPHDGNAQSSEEECEVVLGCLRQLVGSDVMTFPSLSEPKTLGQQDIIIVSPFNAQVSLLQSKLRDGEFGSVRVGTVDLFQGQEAQVVLVSLGSSMSGGRGVEFVLNRKRMNVSISRGKTLAVVIGSRSLGSKYVGEPDILALVNEYRNWMDTLQ